MILRRRGPQGEKPWALYRGLQGSFASERSPANVHPLRAPHMAEDAIVQKSRRRAVDTRPSKGAGEGFARFWETAQNASRGMESGVDVEKRAAGVVLPLLVLGLGELGHARDADALRIVDAVLFHPGRHNAAPRGHPRGVVPGRRPAVED